MQLTDAARKLESVQSPVRELESMAKRFRVTTDFYLFEDKESYRDGYVQDLDEVVDMLKARLK